MLCNPNVFRLGQFNNFNLTLVTVQYCLLQSNQPWGLCTGCTTFATAGVLYRGHSASLTAGSIFETLDLWCYTAAWLISRFVLHELVWISLISATNGFESQCYYFCSYVLFFSMSQHFLYLRHPHGSLQCHALQSKSGWVSPWGCWVHENKQ